MRLKKENSGERLYKIFIYVVLGILAVLILVPVLWVMVASVKETTEHYGSPWALPTHIHWQNFVDAWTKANMGCYLLHSIYITALALAILLIVLGKRKRKTAMLIFGIVFAVLGGLGLFMHLELLGGIQIPILQIGIPAVLSIYFDIFSGFVRGKLLDSLIIGILCFIGCSVLKMPYTPLISVVVGVTNVIPFFGPFLGAIPSIFLILLVDPLKAVYFAIFVLALQQLDGNVIGPKILGDSTGISSFWVIVSILVGGGFFGVLGMFLGVPVFAAIQTLAKYLVDRRLTQHGMPVEEQEYVRRDLRKPAEKKER